MEHILFGFGMEIDHYPKMEIFLYLLIFSLTVGTTGKAASRNQIEEQYSLLIRYGKYSAWWRKSVLLVTRISILLVLCLFGIGALILTLTRTVHTTTEWLAALILWLLGMWTIALIQMVFIPLKNGYKIIFALFMCIDVVSLYQPWLPGSWLMYKRSCLAVQNGFSIWVICLLQIAIDIIIGRFGYLLFKPRRGYGFHYKSKECDKKI